MASEEKDIDKITFKEFIKSDLEELREADGEYLEKLVQEGLEDFRVVGLGRFIGKKFQKGYAAAIILDERYEQHSYVDLFNKRR